VRGVPRSCSLYSQNECDVALWRQSLTCGLGNEDEPGCSWTRNRIGYQRGWPAQAAAWISGQCTSRTDPPTDAGQKI